MLLSIITINYNNINGLKKTVNSVLCQSFRHFEYIIIDGDSNDGSVQFLNDRKNYFAFYVSEKDYGIYNALNKGVLAAKGDYLLFLNSGDYFLNSKILDNVINHLNNDIEIFCLKNYLNIMSQFDFDPLLWIKNKPYFHQSTFFKKNLFLKYGLYKDNIFKIAGDYERELSFVIKHNSSVRCHKLEIVYFDPFGISSKPNIRNHFERLLLELIYIRECKVVFKRIKNVLKLLFK